MKSKITIIFSGAFLALMGFQNCSDVSFKDAPLPANKSCVDDCNPEEVIQSCADAQSKNLIQTYSQNVVFAQQNLPQGQARCSWKPGPGTDETPDDFGNLTMKNEYTRSRIEESVNINIPTDAVLCSVDVRGDNQSFIHDDVFYFTYNNYVLASTLKRSIKTIPEALIPNLEFHQYNWALFRNTVFGFGATHNPPGIAQVPDDYCLGESGGFGACQIPTTDTLGTIIMTFAPEVFVPISLKATNGVHKLGLVVTGDDNPLDSHNFAKDCSHSDLNIDVKVKYYIAQ